MPINENVVVLVTFLLFFLLAFVWPSLRVWRQAGRSAYVLPSSDDAYGFVTRCMKVLMVGLLAYTAFQAFWLRAAAELDLFQVGMPPFLRILAWACLAVALAWTYARNSKWGSPGGSASIKK